MKKLDRAPRKQYTQTSTVYLDDVQIVYFPLSWTMSMKTAHRYLIADSIINIEKTQTFTQRQIKKSANWLWIGRKAFVGIFKWSHLYLQQSNVNDNYNDHFHCLHRNLCAATNYLSWMSCTCHGIMTHSQQTITRITVNHRPRHLITIYLRVHLTSFGIYVWWLRKY